MSVHDDDLKHVGVQDGVQDDDVKGKLRYPHRGVSAINLFAIMYLSKFVHVKSS